MSALLDLIHHYESGNQGAATNPAHPVADVAEALAAARREPNPGATSRATAGEGAAVPAADTQPRRLWSIRHADGHLESHSFTPPATLSEVRGWYPSAPSIEPAHDATTPSPWAAHYAQWFEGIAEPHAVATLNDEQAREAVSAGLVAAELERTSVLVAYRSPAGVYALLALPRDRYDALSIAEALESVARDPGPAPAALPKVLRVEDEALVRGWLDRIGEHDPAIIAETLDRCRRDPAALAYFVARSAEVTQAPAAAAPRFATWAVTYCDGSVETLACNPATSLAEVRRRRPVAADYRPQGKPVAVPSTRTPVQRPAPARKVTP